MNLFTHIGDFCHKLLTRMINRYSLAGPTGPVSMRIEGLVETWPTRKTVLDVERYLQKCHYSVLLNSFVHFVNLTKFLMIERMKIGSRKRWDSNQMEIFLQKYISLPHHPEATSLGIVQVSLRESLAFSVNRV